MCVYVKLCEYIGCYYYACLVKMSSEEEILINVDVPGKNRHPFPYVFTTVYVISKLINEGFPTVLFRLLF